MEKSIDKSKQYHLNPRKISDKELNRLEDHLLKFGDLGGVVYCRNNKAYVGGNQRSKIFDGAEIIITEEYHLPQKDKTVAVGIIQWNDRQYSYREVVFTEEEFKEARVIANSDGGEWDLDILRDNWLVEDLEEWGLDIELDLGELEEETAADANNPYTRKVESPIYEPSEIISGIHELYDETKTLELINEINASDIPEEVKVFLLKAAQRHVVFNYDKIADFYSHADVRVKALMQQSALVIIDFHRAIECGYVTLSDEIKNQYLEEHGE